MKKKQRANFHAGRLLLVPLLLAVIGCAATETPTSFEQSFPTAPIAAPETAPPVSEARVLVTAKPRKTANRRTVPSRTVNAVTLFPYEENKIYSVATSPGYFTALHLEPGEHMPGKAALGDPAPEDWLVEKTVAGTDKGPVVVLLIKPGRPGISTNLFIPTELRTYQLDVTSYAKRAMDMVKWTYPERAPTAVPATPAYEIAFDPTAFNRNYAIEVVSGETPKWTPVGAYDFGGGKTYIEFPARIGQVTAPAFFVIGSSGMAMPAPFRPRGRFYEIDRSFAVAELRQGDTVVRITRGEG